MRFLIVSPVVAGIGAGDAHVEQVSDRMRRLVFTVNHKNDSVMVGCAVHAHNGTYAMRF